MAEYLTPTVVQSVIPIADMTPHVRRQLSAMFEHSNEGNALYFFTMAVVNEPALA